jgi:hypothetical protein
MSSEIQVTDIPEDIEENNASDVHDVTQQSNQTVLISSEDIELVSSQTGIEDKLLIERTIMEFDNDMSKAILSLLGMLPKEIQKEPTDIDLFREILNEKDKIYHDLMSRNKQ